MKYRRLIEILSTQELAIIKLELSKENIDFNVLFENTLQIADTYALGNNGAIIQVIERDYLKSIEILSNIGIELDYDKELDKFEFVNILDLATSNIPVLRKFQLGYRVLIIFITLFTSCAAIILINTIKISTNEIEGKNWCIEEITHNGEVLSPSTKKSAYLIGPYKKCDEEIYFGNRGRIELPGYNTTSINGWWIFKSDDIIEISDVKKFADIYEGEYTIETNFNGTMKFISTKTTITISRRQ